MCQSKIAALVVCSTLSLCADWPRFRGPNGSGIADGAVLPREVSRENLVWRTEVPPGHSSPIVVGKRIFITGFDPHKLLTLAIDARTGAILWRRAIPRTKLGTYHKRNGPASATPASDGERLYVFFPEAGLVAYTHSGEHVWTRDVGQVRNNHGVAASPIVAGDSVIQQCDGDGESLLIAVDRLTGTVRWRAQHSSNGRPSFTTPVLYGSDDIVTGGSSEWIGYSVRSGARKWWIAGMPPQPKASPIVDGGQIIIAAPLFADSAPESLFAFDTGLALDTDGNRRISIAEAGSNERLKTGFGNFDVSGDGEIDEHEWNLRMSKLRGRSVVLSLSRPADGEIGAAALDWRVERSVPNVPTPLLYRQVLYLLKEGGILTALDASTGVVLKQQRLTRALGDYYASPVAGDGKLYVINESGQLSVIEAGRDWKYASAYDLGESAYATPGISGDSVFVRTDRALYRFSAHASVKPAVTH